MRPKTPDMNLDPSLANVPNGFNWDAMTSLTSVSSNPSYTAPDSLPVGPIHPSIQPQSLGPHFPEQHSYRHNSENLDSMMPPSSHIAPLGDTSLPAAILPHPSLLHHIPAPHLADSNDEVEATVVTTPRADGLQNSTAFLETSTRPAFEQGCSNARNAHNARSARRHRRAPVRSQRPTNSDTIQPIHEAARRQRLDSEQLRRDDLGDAFARLKCVLPLSDEKSSRVKLVDRAVAYIHQLETSQATILQRLENA